MADYGHVDDGPTIITATISSDGITASIVYTNKDIKFKSYSYNVKNVVRIDSDLTLSNERSLLAATSVGNYALFGGGRPKYVTEPSLTTVDAFNTSLVRSSVSPLDTARNSLAATSVGKYALFGGGLLEISTVDAYNESLTKTTPPTELAIGRSELAATTIGNYALFGGGVNGSEYINNINNVDMYTSTLVKGDCPALTVARTLLVAATVEGYALFAGGESSTMERTVDAYDSNLTRSNPSELHEKRSEIGAASIKNYAIFAGGESTGAMSKSATTYDNNLVRGQLSLSSYYFAMIGTDINKEYAIIVSGSQYAVQVFDTLLVRHDNVSVPRKKSNFAATSIENYALFAGGIDTNYSTDSMDIFTIS